MDETSPDETTRLPVVAGAYRCRAPGGSPPVNSSGWGTWPLRLLVEEGQLQWA
jgi:hypothetical protein